MEKVVTLAMNMPWMKVAPNSCLSYAVAHLVHDEVRRMVAECEIIGEDGKLCAKSREFFYIVDQFTE